MSSLQPCFPFSLFAFRAGNWTVGNFVLFWGQPRPARDPGSSRHSATLGITFCNINQYRTAVQWLKLGHLYGGSSRVSDGPSDLTSFLANVAFTVWEPAEVSTLPSVAAAPCQPLIGDCSFVCLALSLMKWILWRLLATHFIKFPKFRFLWCCLMIRLKLFLARTTQKWWFALLPWNSQLVMLIQNSQLVLYFRISQLCNYSYRLYNGQTFRRNIFKCTRFTF